MGKRSDFERRPLDKYPTPEAAVLPLLEHLDPATSFEEPCAGNGDLIRHLEKFGHRCISATDIGNPSVPVDARSIETCSAEYFITNPPWQRDIMHDIIENLSKIRPCWFLIDADWMHTKQSAPYMKYCRQIVSVGRVKWIPDSKQTGKDNVAWYLFNSKKRRWPFHRLDGTTTFHARVADDPR